MRFLSNDDVASLLDIGTAIDALRTGYADLQIGDATSIPRIDLFAPTGRESDYYQWGSMAGACRSLGVLAVRIKSDIVSWPKGKVQEKYCVRPGLYSGIILIYRIDNGEPIALMHDGYLQHIRVAAAATIGADVLARSDADTVGLLGSGGMAWAYLEGVAGVRTIKSVRIYSPTKANRDRFAARASEELGLDATAVDGPEDAVRGARIVMSATNSMEPTFDAGWIEPGAHVTNVTRRELSSQVLERADKIIQLGTASIPPGTEVPDMEWKVGAIAAYVCGQPDERARIPSSKAVHDLRHPNLMDLYSGRAPGRSSPTEVTLFANTGSQGLGFAAVGGRVVELAEEQNVGKDVPIEWFLEDIRD